MTIRYNPEAVETLSYAEKRLKNRTGKLFVNNACIMEGPLLEMIKETKRQEELDPTQHILVRESSCNSTVF